MARDIEPTKMTGIAATKGDHHISILAEVVDTGQTVTLSVPYKGYDEATSSYVDSDEALDRANENLAAAGVTVDSATTDIFGKEFEAYLLADGQNATFWKPRNYIRFTPIRTAEARQLRAAAKKYTFETLPLTEFDGVRFNFGIPFEINGEVKNFRISQFRAPASDPADPDILLRTKYANKTTDEFEKSINSEDVNIPAEARERARASLNKMLAVQRQQLMSEYKQTLGLDIESLLKSDDRLSVTIEVESIPNGQYAFLVASLVVDDESQDE